MSIPSSQMRLLLDKNVVRKGVNGLIRTFDQRLISNYTHELVIRDRFEAMVAGLEPPFCYAKLPEVMLPQEALELIQE